MRFAVASEDGTTVAAHTGRCQGFVIYELSESGPTRVEYRSNTFTAHAHGECDGEPNDPYHQHPHEALVAALSDCQGLVTRGLGPRLIADLQARGITPCICSGDQVQQAAEQFARGDLPAADGRTGCCRRR